MTLHADTATTGTGSKRTERLVVGELRDGTPVSVPMRTVTGARLGPTLTLIGMAHGDEVNGVGAINRIIDELDPADLAGTVIGFPVSSPFALISNSRVSTLDYEGLNSNRVYPGDAGGLAVERAARAVFEHGVQGADYLIDFHDGGYDFIARYIITKSEVSDPAFGLRGLELAGYFGQGIPVCEMVVDETQLREGFGGASTFHAATLGIPGLSVELGGAGKLWDWAVTEAVQGTTNVMRGVGMLAGEPVGAAGTPDAPEQIVGQGSSWPRPTRGGWWEQTVALGEVVSAGVKIGHVKDAFGVVVEELVAPYDCVVYDIRNSSAIMTGEWTVHCGRLPA